MSILRNHRVAMRTSRSVPQANIGSLYILSSELFRAGLQSTLRQIMDTNLPPPPSPLPPPPPPPPTSPNPAPPPFPSSPNLNALLYSTVTPLRRGVTSSDAVRDARCVCVYVLTSEGLFIGQTCEGRISQEGCGGWTESSA